VKRDNYRNRVAAAENEVAWTRVGSTEVTDLRKRVLKSAWWSKHVQDSRRVGTAISLKSANGEFWCHCANYEDTGNLLYATHGIGSPLLRLLHAFAHHMVDYTLTDDIHGAEFAKAYLAAVKRWLGAEAKDQLNVAFAKHKVKTRTWSPEARAAAKHRVAMKDLQALREELSK
jgi:hypothetical protein